MQSDLHNGIWYTADLTTRRRQKKKKQGLRKEQEKGKV